MKPGVIRAYEFKVRRRRLRSPFPDADVTAPELASLFRNTFEGEIREHFVVFHLNVHAWLVGYELVAIGSTLGVEVRPGEVFRGALIGGASGLVLAHNHPSNRAIPSNQDDELTYRLYQVGHLVGVPVLDHIIVCDDVHYSYLENGREPWQPDPQPGKQT